MLTKDSYKLLLFIYKIYLERRKSGKSKTESSSFEDDFYISDAELSKMHSSDISDYLRELSREKYLSIDIIGNFKLTDKAVIEMENRFPNGVSQILETLGKIKNAVPFF